MKRLASACETLGLWDRTNAGMNLFFSVLLFVMATSALGVADTNVNSNSCSQHNRDVKNFLRNLYSYALLVEAADSAEDPKWDCNNSADDNGIQELKSEFIRAGWNTGDLENHWFEIAKDFREKGWYIGAYKRNGNGKTSGPTYIVCDKKESNNTLFLTWSKIMTGNENSWFPDSIVVLAVLVVDKLEQTLMQESLRMETFHRIEDSMTENDMDHFPKEITAIPGTEFTNLSDLGTSFNDLIGNSCIFNFMAKLAEKAWSDSRDRYALAGHSLGGSVAQYVAQKISNGANFQAYAFNAIGLDRSYDTPQNLYSFYIKGDAVVYLGSVIGRTQGGQVVQYTPPKDFKWPKKLLDFLTFEWHRLSGVKTGLCDCINDKGNLSIETGSSANGD